MKKNLAIIRNIAWVTVVILLAIFLVSKTEHMQPVAQDATISLAAEERTFSMLDQSGKTVSEKDFAGKPSLMFFGFSHCPAICPGALSDMTIWLEKLGKDSGKVNAVFVSLDPERDTPARLAEYLKSYNSQIVGLTGTAQQVASIAKSYGIYFKKMPPMNDDGEYMVDHSASIYLYDTSGKLISTIDAMENRDIAFAKIQKLIAQK